MGSLCEMNSLIVEIPVDKEQAEILIQSIGLEAKTEDYDRSTVELVFTEHLELRIEAKDLNALRAALNTHLRWIDTSLKLLQS